MGWGGEAALINQKDRDELLRQYCKDNNILFHEIDGRKTSYDKRKFVTYFKSETFRKFISNIFNSDINNSINDYEFCGSIACTLFNKTNITNIVKDYFCNGLSETDLAIKLNTNKTSINKAIHLALDRMVLIEADFEYNHELYRALNIKNRLDKLKSKVIGENNNFSKLTDKDVRAILNRGNNGDSIYDIAKDFNITATNVSFIKSKKSWKHISLCDKINNDEYKEWCKKAEKFASTYNLSFVIFGKMLVNMDSGNFIERIATKEEQQLWIALGGP